MVWVSFKALKAPNVIAWAGWRIDSKSWKRGMGFRGFNIIWWRLLETTISSRLQRSVGLALPTRPAGRATTFGAFGAVHDL